eukprot:4578135-Amphidinium_carterae.1
MRKEETQGLFVRFDIPISKYCRSDGTPVEVVGGASMTLGSKSGTRKQQDRLQCTTLVISSGVS